MTQKIADDQLKVGDIVSYRGQSGTVIEIRPSGVGSWEYDVKFDNPDDSGTFGAGDLVKTGIQKKADFQPGDRVRVIDDPIGDGASLGKEGTVLSLDDSDDPVVQLDGDTLTGAWDQGYLEKIASRTASTDKNGSPVSDGSRVTLPDGRGAIIDFIENGSGSPVASLTADNGEQMDLPTSQLVRTGTITMTQKIAQRYPVQSEEYGGIVNVDADGTINGLSDWTAKCIDDDENLYWPPKPGVADQQVVFYQHDRPEATGVVTAIKKTASWKDVDGNPLDYGNTVEFVGLEDYVGQRGVISDDTPVNSDTIEILMDGELVGFDPSNVRRIAMNKMARNGWLDEYTSEQIAAMPIQVVFMGSSGIENREYPSIGEAQAAHPDIEMDPNNAMRGETYGDESQNWAGSGLPCLRFEDTQANHQLSSALVNNPDDYENSWSAQDSQGNDLAVGDQVKNADPGVNDDPDQIYTITGYEYPQLKTKDGYIMPSSCIKIASVDDPTDAEYNADIQDLDELTPLQRKWNQIQSFVQELKDNGRNYSEALSDACAQYGYEDLTRNVVDSVYTTIAKRRKNEASCPPGLSKDVKDKVKKEYGPDDPKTYQTLWKIKDQQKNSSRRRKTAAWLDSNGVALTVGDQVERAGEPGTFGNIRTLEPNDRVVVDLTFTGASVDVWDTNSYKVTKVGSDRAAHTDSNSMSFERSMLGLMAYIKTDNSARIAAKYTGNADLDFEETALMPSVVADTVADDFARDLGKPELAADYSQKLMDRFTQVYQSNPDWAKGIIADTDASRDLLYSFMYHWAAAYAVERGDMTQSDAMDYQRSKGVMSASVKRTASKKVVSSLLGKRALATTEEDWDAVLDDSPKFKVGDRVQIQGGGVNAGKSGKIVDITPEGDVYYVDIDGSYFDGGESTGIGMYNFDELQKTAMKKSAKFKNGDRVHPKGGDGMLQTMRGFGTCYMDEEGGRVFVKWDDLAGIDTSRPEMTDTSDLEHADGIEAMKRKADYDDATAYFQNLISSDPTMSITLGTGNVIINITDADVQKFPELANQDYFVIDENGKGRVASSAEVSKLRFENRMGMKKKADNIRPQYICFNSELNTFECGDMQFKEDLASIQVVIGGVSEEDALTSMGFSADEISEARSRPDIWVGRGQAGGPVQGMKKKADGPVAVGDTVILRDGVTGKFDMSKADDPGNQFQVSDIMGDWAKLTPGSYGADSMQWKVNDLKKVGSKKIGSKKKAGINPSDLSTSDGDSVRVKIVGTFPDGTMGHKFEGQEGFITEMQAKSYPDNPYEEFDPNEFCMVQIGDAELQFKLSDIEKVALLHTAGSSQYLQTFFEEKNLPYQSWSIEANDGTTHVIDSDVVIEQIMNCGDDEQNAIADMLRKLDFANADILDYLKHLATGLVNGGQV